MQLNLQLLFVIVWGMYCTLEQRCTGCCCAQLGLIFCRGRGTDTSFEEQRSIVVSNCSDILQRSCGSRAAYMVLE
jgi:hypothetical protein